MTLNRSFIWILILSLAINLLVFGGMAGMFVANKQNHTQRSVMVTPKLGNSSFNGTRFLRSLPPIERKKAWAEVTKNNDKYRKNARQVRTLRRQVYFLLLAEQLNHEAIEAALEKLRQAENRASTDGQTLILEILDDLDLDTRRKAVKAMSHPRRLNR